MNKLITSCVLALSALLDAPAGAQTSSEVDAFAADVAVLEWNQIAIDTIGAGPPFPATRLLATTQLAVFEAVNSITREYEPYLATIAGPAQASPEAAAIAAAHGVLRGFFPDAAATLDQRRDDSLAALPEGASKWDGVAIGEAAAAALLAARSNDGSTPPQFYLPPDDAPGDWQLTPSCSASGGTFRHWQEVKPFGIQSAAQFRAAPPFRLGSKRYARDFKEVKALGAATSSQRPQDRADVAQLYAAQPNQIGWNSVARQLASARQDGITRTARTFALLNASLGDAHISVFESKYVYTSWRPETAITRAAEDQNERTQPDATFTPFVPTPCFPSYPSAHGASAGAGSTVLANAYGPGDHNLSNSTPSVPGVVLHYAELDQIVRDVSDARVYGGIHFRNDQVAAERMGAQVAAYNLEHLLRKRPRRAPRP